MCERSVPTGADGSSHRMSSPALRRIRATPRNAQPVVQRSPRYGVARHRLSVVGVEDLVAELVTELGELAP